MSLKLRDKPSKNITILSVTANQIPSRSFNAGDLMVSYTLMQHFLDIQTACIKSSTNNFNNKINWEKWNGRGMEMNMKKNNYGEKKARVLYKYEQRNICCFYSLDIIKNRKAWWSELHSIDTIMVPGNNSVTTPTYTYKV